MRRIISEVQFNWIGLDPYSTEVNQSLFQKYLRRNNLTQAHMWLGLFKSHPKGEFQWVDGSPFGNYTNWSSGEPNNIRGKELCSEMLVFGSTWTLKKWNDIRCDTTQYKPITVCEKFETHKLE